MLNRGIVFLGAGILGIWAASCSTIKTGTHVEAAPLSENVTTKSLPTELGQITQENVVVPAQLLRELVRSEATSRAKCQAMSAQLYALKKVDTETAARKHAQTTAETEATAPKNACGD